MACCYTSCYWQVACLLMSNVRLARSVGSSASTGITNTFYSGCNSITLRRPQTYIRQMKPSKSRHRRLKLYLNISPTCLNENTLENIFLVTGIPITCHTISILCLAWYLHHLLPFIILAQTTLLDSYIVIARSIQANNKNIVAIEALRCKRYQSRPCSLCWWSRMHNFNAIRLKRSLFMYLQCSLRFNGSRMNDNWQTSFARAHSARHCNFSHIYMTAFTLQASIINYRSKSSITVITTLKVIWMLPCTWQSIWSAAIHKHSQITRIEYNWPAYLLYYSWLSDWQHVCRPSRTHLPGNVQRIV